MPSTRSLLFAAVAGLSSIPRLLAQVTTSAQCSSNYSWALNSQQQSPCLVAAYLYSACAGGQFTVDALPVGTHYIGPTVATANPCDCSSVLYCLSSACGDCQGRLFITWSEWNANCSSTSLRTFPEPVPSGTTIPPWAYLDVGASNTYNADLAMQLLNGTSSSAVPTNTGTTSSGSIKQSSGPNIGALVGGIVGGVVALAVIACFVVWWMLRRHRRINEPIIWPELERENVLTPPPTSTTPQPMVQRYSNQFNSPPTSPSPPLTYQTSNYHHSRNPSSGSYLGTAEVQSY